MRLVVVTETLAERDSVLRDLGPVRLARLVPYAETRVASPGAGTVVVIPAGTGPAAAAAAGVALNRLRPDAALCLGLGAGFDDLSTDPPARATDAAGAAAAAVLADRLVALGSDAPPYDVAARAGELLGWVRDRASTAGVPLAVGTVLTVPAPAASTEEVVRRRHRHPDALAEAGSGFDVSAAGLAHRVPVLELRALGGVAGPGPTHAQGEPALDALARLAGAVFAREWRPGPTAA